MTEDYTRWRIVELALWLESLTSSVGGHGECARRLRLLDRTIELICGEQKLVDSLPLERRDNMREWYEAEAQRQLEAEAKKD